MTADVQINSVIVSILPFKLELTMTADMNSVIVSILPFKLELTMTAARKFIDNGHLYIKDKSDGDKRFGSANILEAKGVLAEFIRLETALRKRLENTVILAMHVERKAVTTQDGPTNIVADALNLASQPALGQLTSVNNMKRGIRRARKRKGAMPANPLSLQDSVIPDDFKKTQISTYYTTAGK
ncbi:hypothetical protein CHS0354_031602, partial [Potamilus streckersoni]